MAKITRQNQKIFGSNAGFEEISQFGSLKAGVPAYSTNPETIQALQNYLDGWYEAVIGGNSPAIEDWNAVCYLYAYQLAYLFQQGIPEWNDETTYYEGSLVNDGTGAIYKSITDDNLNNIVTDTANWYPVLPALGTAYQRLAVKSDGTGSEYTYNTINKMDVTDTVSIPSGYSLNASYLNLQSGASYTIANGGGAFIGGSLTINTGASMTVSPTGSLKIN